jgi:small subunit ribosomal protein S6
VPLYESVYIARPDISATQVEALTADMTKILEENGGKVVKDEYWGLKSLAYRIKKNRKGHYSLLNIDCPPAALSEMERNMRIHEDVLRYMSIRVDEHEEEPSVMMQSKSSRDDRDRDRDRGRPPRDDDRPKDAAPDAASDDKPAAAAAETASDADTDKEETKE